MGSLNKVLLLGRLTRDPELRYTPSGTAVADFGLAVSRAYKTAEGEKKESVTFVDITVWAKKAEICAEYLSKGRQVIVEGRLELDSWETQDGQKRSKLKVVAEDVQFIGSAPGGARGEKKGAEAGASAPAEPAEKAAEAGSDDIPF